MVRERSMVIPMNRQADIVIVGGGPAGLAAAAAGKKAGIENILILERDGELGGILNQCIHNGFGLHTFKEELTGPEYAARYISRIKEMGISYLLNTMAADIRAEGKARAQDGCRKKYVTAMNRSEGIYEIEAGAVILAMGCRERARGALNIPGFRPAGIYSAGTAQRYVNIEGRMPGKEVVILGSGDIGLIMARRMTLEGARVKLVAELMPYSGGLKRNIVQCLEDFDIPLKLSHTVIDIDGNERVKGVTVARVDEYRRPVAGTEEYISCDTLLLSCGLIPENELSAGLSVELNETTGGPVVNESFETNIDGVFACGNALHVHDLVDYVSEEAERAGYEAAAYITRKHEAGIHDSTKMHQEGNPNIIIKPVDGVRYTVPSLICAERMQDEQIIRFRVDNVYRDAALIVRFNDMVVIQQNKKIMTPSEMEQVKLRRSALKEFVNRYGEIKVITIEIAVNYKC